MKKAVGPAATFAKLTVLSATAFVNPALYFLLSGEKLSKEKSPV
jgi:hypothetical protein